MANYYDDEPDDQHDRVSGDSDSVLVPKSALGSHECKPGEIIKIKVGKVFDDEVAGEVVGYSDAGEKEKEPEDSDEEEEMAEASPDTVEEQPDEMYS